MKSNDGQSAKKKYPKSPTCDKTNHQAERRWKGTAVHFKPKTQYSKIPKQTMRLLAKVISTPRQQTLFLKV